MAYYTVRIVIILMVAQYALAFSWLKRLFGFSSSSNNNLGTNNSFQNSGGGKQIFDENTRINGEPYSGRNSFKTTRNNQRGTYSRFNNNGNVGQDFTGQTIKSGKGAGDSNFRTTVVKRNGNTVVTNEGVFNGNGLGSIINGRVSLPGLKLSGSGLSGLLGRGHNYIQLWNSKQEDHTPSGGEIHHITNVRRNTGRYAGDGNTFTFSNNRGRPFSSHVTSRGEENSFEADMREFAADMEEFGRDMEQLRDYEYRNYGRSGWLGQRSSAEAEESRRKAGEAGRRAGEAGRRAGEAGRRLGEEARRDAALLRWSRPSQYS